MKTEHDIEEPQILKYGKFGQFQYWVVLCVAHMHILLSVLLIFDARVREAAIVGFLAFACYAFAIFLIRHSAYRDILLFKTHFYIRSRTATEQISFSDIASIKKCRISWWNLFMVNLNSGKSFVITARISGIEHLIASLHLFNESFFKNDDYEKLSSIIIGQRRRNQRNARITESFNWRGFATALGIAATLTAALTLKQLDLIGIKNPADYFGDLFLQYSFVFLIAAILIYTVAEQCLERKEKVRSKLLQNASPDLHVEQRAIRYSFQAFLSFSVITSFAIYAFNLNFLSVTQAGLDIPHVNVSKNEWLFIDKRFTSASGQFSITRNEKISYQLYDSERLGRVVGLPADLVSITAFEKNGRAVAGTEQAVVPENHFAVQAGADGSKTILVPMGRINGRITRNLDEFFER